MITQLISKILNLKELEELEEVKRNLYKVIKKHRRKLIRTKLYLNWEVKYEQKTVKRWVSRIFTFRFFGKTTKIDELTITLNQLSYLTEILKNNGKNYLNLVQKI